MQYYVYILKQIQTGRHYIGYTSNLAKRLSRHNSGRNTSTRCGTWKIIYSETLPSRKVAWKREQQIKKFKGGDASKKLLEKL